MIRSFIARCLIVALALEPFALSTTEYHIAPVADASVAYAGNMLHTSYSTLSEGEVSSNEVLPNEISSNEVSSNEISSNEVPSNEVPLNEISSNEVPVKGVSENHVSENEISVNEPETDVVSDPATNEVWLTRDEHDHVAIYQPVEIQKQVDHVGTSTASAPEKPKISVPAGRIQEGYGFRLTTQTPDADIYYTTDETTPTKNSLLFDKEKNEEGLIFVPGHVSYVTITAVAVSANKMSPVMKATYSVSPYEIEINQNEYKHTASLSRLGCFVSYGPIQSVTTGEAMPYQLYHLKLEPQNSFQASLTATGFNGEVYLLDQETKEILTYAIGTSTTAEEPKIPRVINYVNQTEQTKEYILVVSSGVLSSRHTLGKAGANGSYQLKTTIRKRAVSISVNLAADYVIGKRTLKAYATTYPGDADETRYDWTVRNENGSLASEDIAKVNPYGVITMQDVAKPRIMKVRATNRADRTIYGETAFRVYPRVTKISPVEKKISLTVNGTANTYRADENFTIEPASGYYDSFIYTSSNPRVATVDPDTGLVRALSKGSATIYKKAKDGSAKYGYFTVNVRKIVTKLTIVPGPKATTIRDNYPVVAGCMLNLRADVGPSDANDKSVKFMNGETGVPFPDGVTLKGHYLFVSKNAHTLENFSVKVVAQDGGDDGSHGKTTIRTFCIFEKPTDISIEAQYGRTTLNTAPAMGMNTTKLFATVYNKDGNFDGVTQHVSWSSMNPSIATVDESTGVVTAKKKGTTKIVARALGGTNVAKSIEITVLDGITNMVIHPKNQPANEDAQYPILNGRTVPLTVDMSPLNPSNRSVTWSLISSASGAVINPKTGAVTTPRSYNRTTLTVKAESNDGTGVYALATLKVVPAINQIEIREAPKVLNTATQPEGIVEVLVTGHSDAWRELNWTSSDPSIASVEVINEIKAVVVAHKKGRVRITAAATDGTRHKASTVIKVVEPLEDFVIATSTGAASVSGEPICISGKSTRLIPAQMTPSQPSNKYIDWTFLEEDPTKQVKINPSSGAVTVSRDLSYPKELTVVASVRSGTAVISQNVLICPATKSIHLVKSQKKIGLYPGTQYTLDPTSNPSRAYSEYEFHSTAPGIVSVSDAGILSAHKKGTARIIIRARDGSGVLTTSLITVY